MHQMFTRKVLILMAMTRKPTLLSRLLPAAFATASFAALAHALMVGIAAQSVGLEIVYIASLSFLVALIVAVAGGALLLAITKALRLCPVSSLLLFLLSIQAVAIGLQFYLFEFQNGWGDISWQYGLISVPASLIAWHQSAFYVHKRV